MSLRLLPVVLAVALALAPTPAEAATHVVTVSSNVFSPQVLTVRIGDTVTWNNVSGTHNVISDDGTFTSGNAALAPWSYSVTFTSTGTFPYYCQPHGSLGGSGQSGSIVVVDALELAHGSDLVEDLAGVPDRYRMGQRPFASYEVVAEPVAGNPLLQVDRVDAAGTGLIQAGVAVTAAIDMVQSLRWQNNSASAQDTQRVRVGNASCPGACTGNDRYRLRAYETTLAIPRFNNSGTQVSVVILQNPTDYIISGAIYFWNTAGTLLNTPAGQTFALAARQTLVLQAASVTGVSGQSGTVTVSHTGRYGDLTGKVVALEPATGFSFDTPAIVRPR